MMRPFLLLVVLAVASGCGTVRLPTAPPATFAEANRVLNGRRATVQHADGVREAAADVTLSPDSARYTPHGGAEVAVPLDRIYYVELTEAAKLGPSILIWGAPGLFVTARGMRALSDSGRQGTVGSGEFSRIGMGITLTAAGLVVGALYGKAYSPSRTLIVYDHRLPPHGP